MLREDGSCCWGISPAPVRSSTCSLSIFSSILLEVTVVDEDVDERDWEDDTGGGGDNGFGGGGGADGGGTFADPH